MLKRYRFLACSDPAAIAQESKHENISKPQVRLFVDGIFSKHYLEEILDHSGRESID